MTTLEGFSFSPILVFYDNLYPQSPDTFEAVRLLTRLQNLQRIKWEIDCNPIKKEALFPASEKKKTSKEKRNCRKLNFLVTGIKRKFAHFSTSLFPCLKALQINNLCLRRNPKDTRLSLVPLMNQLYKTIKVF